MEVFFTIKNVTGDNTGIIHVLPKQNIVLSQSSIINSTLHLYETSTAYMPHKLTTPSQTSHILKGKVCGLADVFVSGTFDLYQTGSTCGNSRSGQFNMSHIVVYQGGIVTDTTKPVNISASSCVFDGGLISPTIGLSEPSGNGIVNCFT